MAMLPVAVGNHNSGRAWASPELHEKPEAVYIIYLYVILHSNEVMCMLQWPHMKGLKIVHICTIYDRLSALYINAILAHKRSS